MISSFLFRILVRFHMSDTIIPVPLFRYQSFENFFKRKSDDFERIPLLALGCLCLVADKIQNLGGFSWGHVADFGKIGNKVSSLADYWELGDFLNGGYTVFTAAWTIYTTADLSSEKGKSEVLATTKKAALYAGKAFSSLVNFIEMLVEVSALKGLNIHRWKLIGSALGAVYFGRALYEDFCKSGLDPEDIKEVKDVARNMYRKQHIRKVFYDNLITASVLAMKVVGFCAACSALYSVPKIVGVVANYKGNLLLGSFVGFTTGIIGSHLYGEQMKTFKHENKVG